MTLGDSSINTPLAIPYRTIRASNGSGMRIAAASSWVDIDDPSGTCSGILNRVIKSMFTVSVVYKVIQKV